jgi:hypothetical protein
VYSSHLSQLGCRNNYSTGLIIFFTATKNDIRSFPFFASSGDVVTVNSRGNNDHSVNLQVTVFMKTKTPVKNTLHRHT